MAKLVFDEIGKRLYQIGISECVLFVQKANGTYENGVAWNGVTGITESPSGADVTALWADNIKYLELRAAEEFGGTIEAYTYPDEFEECDGTASVADGVVIGQQKRKRFALAYKTKIGNDTAGDDYGYKLHIIYNASASPTERSFQTVNDSPDVEASSWEFTTTPVACGANYKPTSIITIDSTKADATKLTTLLNQIYGGDSTESTLPTPEAVITNFA